MLMIVHALLGGLIGLEVNSVALIALIAVASHFIMDMLPHWDGEFDKRHFQATGKAKLNGHLVLVHAIDITISVLVIALLFQHFESKLFLVGVFFSVFPDMIKIGYVTKLRENNSYMKHLKFHSKIQNEVRWEKGLLIQFIFVWIIIKMIL